MIEFIISSIPIFALGLVVGGYLKLALDAFPYWLGREPTALMLVAAERRRQVEVEGFSLKADDYYIRDELARAAACYATPGSVNDLAWCSWPWPTDWWKPSPDDRIRDLVKAGALILAEIDRLLRRQAKS